MKSIHIQSFMSSSFALLFLASLPQKCAVVGFTPTSLTTRRLEVLNMSNEIVHERRVFVNSLFQSALVGISVLSTEDAQATLMDNNVEEIKIFDGNTKLTIPEAKSRFKLAIQDVDELLSNYSEIAKNGGGDNVRRYLGTVGVKSHMYGITKVLKLLREEADDIVEFTEASNEFEAYLFQAEGAAYQSLFTEHSSAKSTPESLLATAKTDVVAMRKYMGELAEQLHL